MGIKGWAMKKAFLTSFAAALAGLSASTTTSEAAATPSKLPTAEDAQVGQSQGPSLPRNMLPGDQDFVLKRAHDGSMQAYHQSHYSHRSHSSHRSHYSGN